MQPSVEVRRAATAVYDGSATEKERIVVIEFIRLNATSKVFNSATLTSIYAPLLLEYWTNPTLWMLYETLLERG